MAKREHEGNAVANLQGELHEYKMLESDAYCREARSGDSTALVRHERGFHHGNRNEGRRATATKSQSRGLVRTHGRSPHGREIMDYQPAKLVSGFVVIARKPSDIVASLVRVRLSTTRYLLIS